MPTPLIIGPREEDQLLALQARAALRPVDMPKAVEALKTADGKRRHMDQMNDQTVEIPIGFLVTYSLEIGHPVGTCRHMSMSSPAKGRLPSLEGVWMVAGHLGFKGGLEACRVWIEDLQRGAGRANAVNVIQPVAVSEPHRA